MTDQRLEMMASSATTPSPAEIRPAGRLKIFFGAAPGAGKTLAMLHAARNRLEQKRRVAVGWVESHGRREIDELCSIFGAPLLQNAAPDGRSAKEFDLDAALALKPALILLDELAHANGPGCRHRRRWQDVEELLAAGIDVYTTLDVFSLESQKDLILQISGIGIQNSVPDRIFEQADEIELVDVPATELLERLEQGKISLAGWSQREIADFFRPGVILALRELALRRAAEKIDEQMRRYRRQEGITAVWPATERLLVCVGPNPRSDRLIRAARRMAAGLRAPWLAVHVEAPPTVRPSPQDLLKLEEHMRLAASLGAETVTLRGERAGAAILDFARARNVTKIIVGKPTHPRWKDRLFGSLLDDIVRGSEDIEVYVITGDAPQPERVYAFGGLRLSRPAKEWLLAMASVAGCFALASLIAPYVVASDLVMVFLLGIVLVAGRWGRGPSRLATLLSIALFDFFFVPPFHTFAVHDPAYLVTFGAMFLVAEVISRLTLRVKEQAAAAHLRERRTAALYALSRDLVHERCAATISDIAARHIGEVLSCRAQILSPQELSPNLPAQDRFGEAERQAAEWALQNRKAAGAGTDTHSEANALFMPLLAATGAVGVIGLWSEGFRGGLSSEQMRLLGSLADQTAQALERVQLAEEAQKAVIAAEQERLRNTLLSSVSHDLRTPLAAITGAGTTLLQNEGLLDAENRRELMHTIVEEAAHLNRLIRNVLDMTRLEAGGITVSREWQSLEEIVGAVANRMAGQFRDHPLTIQLPSNLPLVPCDALLIEQVLRNLLENAVKHTPAGTPITLSAAIENQEALIRVADRGEGIAPEETERLFQKFARGKHSGGGAGLGLAICRGIVAAHGGRIWLEKGADRGARFAFTLPTEALPFPVTPEEKGTDDDR